MYIIDYCSYFFDTQASLGHLEKDMVKAQAKIYQASCLCEEKHIDEEQNVNLCSKDALLVIVQHVMQLIKKKSNCAAFITKRF